MAKHLIEGRAFPLFYYGLTYCLAWRRGLPSRSSSWPVRRCWRFDYRCSPGIWRSAFLMHRRIASAPLGCGPGSALARRRCSSWRLRHRSPRSWSTRREATSSRSCTLVRSGFCAGIPCGSARCWPSASETGSSRCMRCPFYWRSKFTRQMDRARVREWLMSLAMFFAVWESIEALKPFADFGGPGTRGQLLGGFSGSQLSNLTGRFNWQAGALGERIGRMGGELDGVAPGRPPDRQQPADSGPPWLVWAGGLGVLAGRGPPDLVVVRTGRRRRLEPRLVADVAATGRAARSSRSISSESGTWRLRLSGRQACCQGYSRYVLLGLLVPVGLTAALLRLESRRDAPATHHDRRRPAGER